MSNALLGMFEVTKMYLCISMGDVLGAVARFSPDFMAPGRRPSQEGERGAL